MTGFWVLLLLGLGVVITLLAYSFQDYLVLSKQAFAISISILRISTFFLVLFMSLTLISLGQKVVSRRLYLLGLFLIPALIPDLFHILSFSFFPDFITENKRHKTAYLYLFSRAMVILALYLSVFSERFFQKERDYKSLLIILTAISLLLSFGIVLYYQNLPPIFLEMDSIKPAWYKIAYDVLSIVLLVFIAVYTHRKGLFGERVSPYISLSVGFIALSVFAFSLALHKYVFDFMVPLASFFRSVGYGLFTFSVLYLSVRKESKAIMESTRKLLTLLMKEKPVKEGEVLYLRLGKGLTYGISNLFLYDFRKEKWVAQVYEEEKKAMPNVNLTDMKKFLQGIGGTYLGRDYHYSMYEDYLVVTEVTSEYNKDAESPLKHLHILNTERLLLGYLLNWLNFDRIMEEKTKELQRLYLLLETSEYATQAYNNIDTFSRQVLERLDYVLKMDGSLFYMWNKNAELPERVVFSSGFLQNFPDFKLHQLLERLMESPEMQGAGDNYIYCKFESNSYQSGLVGLRMEKQFNKEEVLFLKTVGNQLFHVVKLMKVIEDLEKAQASIRFLSEYDPFTMLYNRKSFEKILEEEIERSDRSGEPLCLLFVDVDNFKVINDTYGYHVGDMVLRHVAEVLKRRIRKLDTAGRLGGDEFGIILPKANKTVVEYIADRIRQQVVNTPLIIGDTEIRVSLSVGIVCYPIDVKTKEEMLSLGEALMHAIKREGKGRIRMVEESVRELYTAFRRVEREILESFEKGSIEVFMQDIVNLNTERVEGFEALMRLRIKDDILPAGRFIHIAEHMGIVQKLDLLMVEEVFKKLSSINSHGSILIFLNLSPQDLREEFIEDVIGRAKTHGVNAQHIVFEITEREAIQDIGRMNTFIKRLKEVGFKFAIDDFGSGYASFLYLKYLPVDFLKIEGEFIKSMRKSHIDRIFVKSMVDVAKGLGIKTIAEYVEDAQTLEILLDLGVDYAQGYYIGKPGPAEEKLRSLFSRE